MRGEFDTTALIAGRQHGRVAWAQLVAAGVDAGRVERWLADGRLRRVHHGVYAVGHVAASRQGDLMAAVLACGDHAAVSHASAAHLLGLVRAAPHVPEVIVPTTAGRRRPGIVVHRVRKLHPRDVSRLEGIPITTAPRVLLDMAPRLPPAELARMCHEAWVRYGVGPSAVEACIARNPHKKGLAKLRRALGSDVTLSALEDGFLDLLREHQLALPRTNVDRAGDKVDCYWPAFDIVVELHSFRYHATRQAFEIDLARRRRSCHLAFSYGDVFERGHRTAAELRVLLAPRRGVGAGN